MNSTDEALLAEIKEREKHWPSDNPDRRDLLRLLSACQARVEEAEKLCDITRDELLRTDALVKYLQTHDLEVAIDKADARRYRWIRGEGEGQHPFLLAAVCDKSMTLDHMDSAVDRAIAALGADGGGTKT